MFYGQAEPRQNFVLTDIKGENDMATKATTAARACVHVVVSLTQGGSTDFHAARRAIDGKMKFPELIQASLDVDVAIQGCGDKDLGPDNLIPDKVRILQERMAETFSITVEAKMAAKADAETMPVDVTALVDDIITMSVNFKPSNESPYFKQAVATLIHNHCAVNLLRTTQDADDAAHVGEANQ